MKWFLNLKIGLKLSLVITLVMLISFSFLGLYAYFTAQSLLTTNINMFYSSSAQEAAKQIRHILNIELTKIESIAARPEIKTMDWSVQENVLKQEVERIGSMRLNIIDPNGFARSTDGTTADLSTRSYFTKALQGIPNASDPIVSKFDGSVVSVFAAPIKDEEGKIIGVLTSTVDYTTLSKLMADITVGESGYSFITNSSGTLIAHPNFQYVMDGYNFIEEAKEDESLNALADTVRKMIKGETGNGEYWFEGEDKFVSYAPIPETDWSVGLNIAKSEVFAGVNTLRANMILVTIFFLVICIACVVLLSRKFVAKPVNSLVGVSEKLADGDIDVSISTSSTDEIGTLMKSFKRIIDNTSNKVHAAQKIASGDLTANVEIVSEKDILSKSMYNIIDTLKDLRDETTMLTNEAINGNLGARGDINNFKGAYKEIVEGINNTLDAVIAPINEAKTVLEKVSEGNLDVSVEGNYKGDHAEIKNALNNTISLLSSYIKEISHVLSEISKGNLDVNVQLDYKGDFVEIQHSLERIIKSLNEVIFDINNVAKQVGEGAKQVANSSQVLAQASTEQASSIQELNATISEIADDIKHNALNATKASELAVVGKDDAQNGNEQMKSMLNAMDTINESSQNISKIIKVIDEIAFQTNILALNAAVEAARAGHHGKGFAVVAEEVRNLASRSADAAKETTALIEGTIKNVNVGTEIANNTAKALDNIVNSTTKSADIMNEIASVSNQQASSIAQIEQAIDQVSQVTQNNSATSEESASAGEELLNQANNLISTVNKFNIKEMANSFPINQLNAEVIKMLKEESEKRSNKGNSVNNDFQINLSNDFGDLDKY